MIDIVIPVYNAAQDLRDCVASVFAHTPPEAFTLTLIDDGSPDPTVKDALAELSARYPALRVLANPKNMGFTATVNRAFEETTGDVLLLNSDTLVTPGWLPAMSACLASDGKIASVTPFSNNAEIASIPQWLKPNPVPTAQEAALYAQACADTDAHQYPDLPTGVGFCMLLRRAAIEAIGPFDESTFGRGYGEENDWCQRALKAGWRNVLCVGAYVVHTGGRSFSEEKAALVAAHIVKLNAKHPGYDLQVQRFIAKDPIKPYREAVISRFHALAGAAKPGVLHILHGKDGGLERHARNLVSIHVSARHYILLALGENWVIEDHTSSPPLTFRIRHQTDELWRDFFDGVCQRFNITVVHVHHISSNRDGLLLALEHTPLPIIVTLHDFYYQCPAVHLLDDQDRYCGGEVDARLCQRCIDRHPHAPRTDVVHWRARNERLLRRARQVIAPTQFTANMTRRVFPDLPIRVLPHDSNIQGAALSSAARKPAPSPWRTLATVGAIGPNKGARVVEAIARRLAQRGLPARMVVIGYLDKQFTPTQSADGRFIVHGAYAAHELGQLLSNYQVDAIIFPGIGPETFGFVLSEAWAHGYAPIVSAIGALEERVRASGGGWVLPPVDGGSEQLDAWIDHALKIAQAPESAQAERARLGQDLVKKEAEIARSWDYAAYHAPAPARLRALNNARWIQAGASASVAGLATEASRTRTRIGSVLRRLLGFALTWRYTALGRALEHRLSATTKRRLRSWILRH